MADVKKFLFLDQDGQMAEQKATDTIQVANGVNALDAVNKGQLDGAVGSLTDLINAEAARAAQAEAALGDSITAEQTARIAADAALSASLTSETNARTAADTALGGRIDAEEAARIAADSAEASARAAADTALRNDLDAEIARATAAESAEATARTNADAALQAAIDALSSSSNSALTAAINSLTADLEAEEAARIAADAALQTELDAEEARAAAAEAAESAARIAADNALQSAIDDEEAARIAAVAALQAELDAEEARAAAAEQDLADDIAAEQSRAQTAEGNLQTALNAEIDRAEAAEAVLTADLAAEIARATSTEAANLQEAKDYADARVQGLSWKASVDYAYPRTGAHTLPADAAALIAADGLAVGSRVLVYSADQSAHADNGIYVVSGTSFVRAADMAAGKDAAGATVYVERATDAGAAPGTSFVCANAGSAIVGTDALEFVIFSRAENLTFGSGVEKSGVAVSVKTEALRPIQINGNGAVDLLVGENLAVDEMGQLKVSGYLVGGSYVSANTLHMHENVATIIGSCTQTFGVAVKSDGTPATYDSSYFRGVVNENLSGTVARVVTSGECGTASGALSSFVADEIVYLGSAAGVYAKYADIPSGKWAVPVGFCIDGSSLTVHRMPAALKA